MSKAISFAIIILIISNIFTWWIISDALHSKIGVSFLNVGQGDAELIQTQAGNILIDAGPNNKVLFELGKILPFYERTIDLVILSHPNKDHYNGLFELLDKYKIRAVMLNNYTYPSSTFQKLLQELQKRNILLIKGVEKVEVSWQNQDKLSIIYPPEQLFFNNNTNASCLVVSLLMGSNQFLFTGDIGSGQEQKILPLLKNLLANFKILKVSHHGSNSASSEKFLEMFQPQMAIIEVGKNNYGQPHPNVLERLESLGAQIFRTDLSGTIRFFYDNNGLKLQLL